MVRTISRGEQAARRYLHDKEMARHKRLWRIELAVVVVLLIAASALGLYGVLWVSQ